MGTESSPNRLRLSLGRQFKAHDLSELGPENPIQVLEVIAVKANELDLVTVVLGHFPLHDSLILLASPEQTPILDVDVIVL